MPYANREKDRQYRRDYHARQQAAPGYRRKRRDRELRRKYGITIEQYEAMLIAQSGHCALCPKLPGKRDFAVDHCHVTHRVRGLLCTHCNVTVGAVENIGLLSVDRYLRAS